MVVGVAAPRGRTLPPLRPVVRQRRVLIPYISTASSGNRNSGTNHSTSCRRFKSRGPGIAAILEVLRLPPEGEGSEIHGFAKRNRDGSPGVAHANNPHRSG